MASTIVRNIKILALVALLTLPMAASTVQSVSFDQLSKTAHHIVAGRIVNIAASRNEETGHIYSDISVLVSHSSPGSLAGHRYTFRMIGGEIDGKQLYIADFPQLKLNEKVVLFLNDTTSTVFGPTIGLWQGVFFVGDSDRAAVTDHLRRPIVSVKQGEVLPGAKSTDTAMSLDDFFTEVEAHRAVQ
jgi:hypothetical protein